MSATTIRMPSVAARCATALPMPLAPPVMTATFPCRSSIGGLLRRPGVPSGVKHGRGDPASAPRSTTAACRLLIHRPDRQNASSGRRRFDAREHDVGTLQRREHRRVDLDVVQVPGVHENVPAFDCVHQVGLGRGADPDPTSRRGVARSRRADSGRRRRAPVDLQGAAPRRAGYAGVPSRTRGGRCRRPRRGLDERRQQPNRRTRHRGRRCSPRGRAARLRGAVRYPARRAAEGPEPRRRRRS